MSKVVQLAPFIKNGAPRVSDLALGQAVEGHLIQLIADLDLLNENVAAAYAQMALDVIRR